VLVGDALDLVRRKLPDMATTCAVDAESVVRLLMGDVATRSAVLARDRFVERYAWPEGHATPMDPPGKWTMREVEIDGKQVKIPIPPQVETFIPPPLDEAEWAALFFLKYTPHCCRNAFQEPPHPFILPIDVAPLDALKWARDALARVNEDGPEGVDKVIRAAAPGGNGSFSLPVFFLNDPESKRRLVLTPYMLGLVFAVWREVERGRQKQGLAIDAGSPHHHMLAGWVALPKDIREGGQKARVTRHEDGWVELVPPRGSGKPVALGLPGVVAEGFVHALREWRSYRGLRHWAAFQHGLSANRREGWFVWTMERHLEAMGIPRSEWREELLREVAEDVELFTELEFAVRDAPNGKVRQRFKVFEVVKQDVLDGTRWRLDGTRFRPNSLIYSGVRKESGALGSNFGWAPAELPRIRDNRYGPAIVLGLLLPIRWRWVLLNEGKDHLALSGANVLEVAGIRFHRNEPGKAWTRLDRNLLELQRVDGVGRWEWDEWGEEQKRLPDLRNILRLYPPDWVRDRMLHGVTPLELGPAPLTGAELRGWRERRGLSQAAAAKTLAVGLRTMKRAEVEATKPLGPALRDALREALASAMV
jgi:hypothetical protein